MSTQERKGEERMVGLREGRRAGGKETGGRKRRRRRGERRRGGVRDWERGRERTKKPENRKVENKTID